MNTKTFCSAIALLLATIFTNTLNAQQQDQQAAMQAWSAYMTPGDMHAVLAKLDGNWDTEISMWMEPSGQPMKSKGTCEYKMILGGRYQQSEFKGDFMGQSMQGVGTTGYDNAKKTFESVWIDNMGTGIMKMQGTYDAASKTFNFSGTQSDFMSGGELAVREVMKIVDDNTHVMEMYITPNGVPEFKTMEIKYTRKK